MKTTQQLSDVQLDALLEVSNIGSGHAATVLSKMSGSPIMISTPELFVSQLSDAGDRLREGDEPLVATAAEIHGDLDGHIAFVTSESRATELCEMLMNGRPGPLSIHDEDSQSCFKEVGNILGAGFMNALASLLGMVLYPSVPTLTIDPPSLLAEGLGFGTGSDLGLYIRTTFRVIGQKDTDGASDAGESLSGMFLFLPTGKSLDGIFAAIKIS